jgi:hypothetical protein
MYPATSICPKFSTYENERLFLNLSEEVWNKLGSKVSLNVHFSVCRTNVVYDKIHYIASSVDEMSTAASNVSFNVIEYPMVNRVLPGPNTYRMINKEGRFKGLIPVIGQLES